MMTVQPARHTRVICIRRTRCWVSLVAVVLLITGFTQLVMAPTAGAASSPDLAPFGVVSASAYQDDSDGNFPPENVVDGDPGTRWASGNGPDADVEFTAWIQVDLGSPAALDRIGLNWEAAYATRYNIQVASADPGTDSWTTVGAVDNRDGGVDELILGTPVTARYVRVNMLERRSQWDWTTDQHWYGYSLFGFEVNGIAAVTTVGFTSAAQSIPAGTAEVVQLRLNSLPHRNSLCACRRPAGPLLPARTSPPTTKR